ncbi:phosphate ABC transporter substrate-binding protein [Candidatus Magnetoovum chiemensis]|nr:phosphate ABC transporter substrate-binding protein [Candidatus Magnetoovum chiemensis]
MSRFGKCTNFANCSKADNQEKIMITQPISPSTQPPCPECGKELIVIDEGGRFPILKIAVVMIVCAIAVGGYLFFGKSKTPQMTSSSQQPAVDTTNPIQSPTPPAQTPSPTPKPAAEKVILRLQGSNSIGSALAPALAEAFLKKEGASNVQHLKEQDALAINGTFPDGLVSIKIKAKGSSTAFSGLENSEYYIGLASRKIHTDELQRLKNTGIGDMTSRNSEHVLGLDGIAVIVNGSNPVSSLSIDDIREMFCGNITAWNKFKGPSGSINVYARNEDSGTFDTFKGLVLKGCNIYAQAERIEDSNELSDKVAGDLNGIGFIAMPYIRSAKAVEVYHKGAMALKPTFFTVAREDYPLARRLYLYTPQFPKNPYIMKFVEFALSKDGQTIVSQNGFIEQTIKLEKKEDIPAQNTSAPKDKYEELTFGAVQMSTNFRFKSGSDELDNRAVRDLDRLEDALRQPENATRDLFIIGFADKTGDEHRNVLLSRSRALTLSEELKKRGIVAKIVDGFGSKRPVAPNDTEEGREKNRRVEVWLKK